MTRSKPLSYRIANALATTVTLMAGGVFIATFALVAVTRLAA